MNQQHGPVENLRELDEAALEFKKTVAARAARKAQPCKAVGSFIACRIGIALNEHDDRVRVAAFREFARMFEPERIGDDAIFEFAVATARTQVMIVRTRRVE